MKKFKQLGLIGCGMMGGSFALAAKEAGIVERVVGYSKSPSNSEIAKGMGVIDEIAASALQAVMDSDLVLLSVPVAATSEIFKAIRFGYPSKALVMDVGSTKQDVMEAAEKVFGTVPANFVPSHPIAGKAQAGIREADVNLYKNHRVIVTPTQETNLADVERACDVWHALGMKVSRMNARSHDDIFAAVSHVPHLLSFAFINGLNAQNAAPDFWKLAGPGFRDFTRIAASEPDMWRDILMVNQEAILAQVAQFQKALTQLQDAMRNEDAARVKELIQSASQARAGWVMNAQNINFAND